MIIPAFTHPYKTWFEANEWTHNKLVKESEQLETEKMYRIPEFVIPKNPVHEQLCKFL